MVKHLTSILRIASISVSLSILSLLAPQSVLASDNDHTPVVYDTMLVDIQVLENGNLEIRETLSIIFNERRRGIIRHIPKIQSNGLKKRSYPIKFQYALRNGEEEEVDRIDDFRDFGIRLGNEDIFLTDKQVYEIAYIVSDAISFGPDYDELHWNISGNDWEERWLNVEARISFPENINFQNLKCFTGDFGSTEQNCTIEAEETVIITSANDYLTIIAQVDPGILQNKGIFYNLLKFLLDNFLYILGILNITYYGIHSYKNRDLEIGNIITEFNPPKNMEIEDIIFFYRKASASLIATTLMVSLAVKGYIEFETIQLKRRWPFFRSRKPIIKINRLKTDIDDLPKAEKKIFNEVLDFKNKDSVTSTELSIDDKVGRKVKEIRNDIRGQKEVNGINLYDPESYKNNLGIPAFITMFVIGFSFLIFAGATSFTGLNAIEMIFFIVATIVSLKFAHGNLQRTPEAIQITRHILGFKHFMHVAERYRSKWKEQTGQLTKYIPYAVLFKDIEHWSSVMKDIGIVSSDNINSRSMNLSSIASISIISSSINSSISTSSSSSSGGSGGGGGGGGGSSW